MASIFPQTATFLYYPYECDLTDANNDPLVGQIKAIVDPTQLSLGGSANEIPEGDITLPYPLTTSKKRRGILPRHVVLGVLPTGKTKTSIVKIPILAKITAVDLLDFNDVLNSDFFTYAGFAGTITIQNYVQEQYFRVYETPQSASALLRNDLPLDPNPMPDSRLEITEIRKDRKRRERAQRHLGRLGS